MIKKTIISVLASGILISSSLSFGADDKGAASLVKRKSPEAIISERLKMARPDMQFGEPSPAPIKGLYQVQVTGGPLLYITPEGDKFIAGDIFVIDGNGFSRYEDPRIIEDRKALLAKVDPKDTINFKPKDKTKAVVYVFTDIDCGYCRKLHNQVHAYDENGQTKPGYNDLGIEVRYLAYPRAGIPSASADKLITAWCSKDQQKTLTALKNEQPVQPASCEKNPVAADFQLGAKVGVNGTPAIWLPDGRLMPGYMPPEQLAGVLGIK